MILQLSSKNNLAENSLYIPSLISLIAMKNAFITKIPMLQNHETIKPSEVEIEIHFEKPISDILSSEFQLQVEKMLSIYFQMSSEDVIISWR